MAVSGQAARWLRDNVPGRVRECLPETACCQFGAIYSGIKMSSKLEPGAAQAVVDSSRGQPGVFHRPCWSDTPLNN